MVYHIEDLYTTSGASKLYGCWTEEVTKFNSESFYSWEQDNEPLYDLEERTHLLWEKLGFEPSSIPGMVLLVSGDAPNSVTSCNGNIYQSVSALTSRLPKVINYPIIVEIASFGNLGNLDLDGISFGPSGSLEIVNRNYYWSKYSVSSNLVSHSHVTTGPHGSYGNIIKSVSAGLLDGDINPYYLNYPGYPPSSLLGIPVFSATYPALDARVNTNLNTIFSYYPFTSSIAAGQYTRLSVGFDSGYVSSFGGGLIVSSTPFEEGATTEIQTYDPSSYDYATTATKYYREATLGKGANYIGYCNYFESVKISNCGGPIYLRGFLVEGEGTRDIGVSVHNSVVFFEDLAIDRFIEKGIEIHNAEAHFYKNFNVSRCYGFTTGSERASLAWSANIEYDAYLEDESVGFEAKNSEIIFDNKADRDYTLRAASIAVNPWYSAANNLVSFSRNSTGMKLVNSTLRCENRRTSVASISSESTSALSVMTFEGNANCGLLLENSLIDYASRIEFVQNSRGLLATDSTLNVNEFEFESNQLYGLHLVKCTFRYGKNLIDSSTRWDLVDTSPYSSLSDPRFTYSFKNNGQHIILCGSRIRFPYAKSMPTKFGRFYFHNAHKIDILGNPEASISLDDSELELIHASIGRSHITNKTTNGSCIKASRGSKIKFLGSEKCATFIHAEDSSWSYQLTKNVAAISIDTGSCISFRGPTLITGFGVAVLASEDSNISFEPHKNHAGGVDVSGFNLTEPKNHTMVELLATKACLVADKSSSIVMENLGDYNVHWANSVIGGTILSAVNYNSSSAGYNTAQYTSAGYMQFYPNPNSDDSYTGAGVANGLSILPANAGIKGSGPYYILFNYSNGDPYSLSSVTNGGMCVRALNSSNVKSKNVHFPCKWWNPSSVIYDASASDGVCSRLFIWNIAGDSTLNMSYASVSGAYPADAGYHGPSAVWLSATNSANRGMPSGTPDTSALSILDQFGVGGNFLVLGGGTYYYGQTSWENQGPFRLYVSVDSIATFMKHTGSYPGVAYQLWSQGYQVSSNLEPVDYTLSATYGKILRINSSQQLQSSGYYYCDEMVNVNPNNILLDESASNTFANAKSGATKSSRKPQICVIYSTKTNDYGEAKSDSSTTLGRGFKSSNIFDIADKS